MDPVTLFTTVLAVGSVTHRWLAGSKVWWCWAIALLLDAAWITFYAVQGYPALVVMSFGFSAVHLRNLRKWWLERDPMAVGYARG